MYRNLVTLLAAAFILASCKDRQRALTETQIKAKVDSLVGIKVQELATQSAEDLDRRMSIEVKAKADSIVQARLSGTTATTTSTTTTTTAAAHKPDTAARPRRVIAPAGMPAAER